MSQTAITVTDVSVHYQQATALQNISVTINSGAMTAILVQGNPEGVFGKDAARHVGGDAACGIGLDITLPLRAFMIALQLRQPDPCLTPLSLGGLQGRQHRRPFVIQLFQRLDARQFGRGQGLP